MNGSVTRKMDFAGGNLFLKIGFFAIPMAFATVFQLLYSTVDLVTVHYFGGGQSSASAISANGSLINLIVVMFSAMAIGANVAIGNALGANRQEDAEKTLHTSFLFALATGVCVGAIGYFVTPYLLKLIQTHADYMENATTYMRVYFIGLPFLMVFNYGSQMHRAIGDSLTPFVILAISGLVNVVFDLIFVIVFGMDVFGVSLATVISEAISAILVVSSFAFRKKMWIRFSFKKLRIDGRALMEIIRLGVPAGLQGFFFALPNTFIQSALYQIAGDNVDLLDGAIAANSLNNYCYAFVEAISASCMAFTAYNYGARNKELIKKAFWYSLIWMAIWNAVYALLILFAYHPLLSLFVDADNEASIEAGKTRLWIVGLTYFLDGAMDVCASSMKGVRQTKQPMWITLLTCTVSRIVLIYAVVLRIPYFSTVLWLYSLYPISWVLAVIADAIILPLIWKKTFRKIDEENKASSLLEEHEPQ